VSSNNGNKKEIAKPVLVTINKVPLLPPLLAKTKKEVNVISVVTTTRHSRTNDLTMSKALQ